jgi:putative membrane protein
MTTIAAGFALAALTTGLASSQQAPAPTQGSQPAPVTSDRRETSADRTFVMKMAQGGMAEVELGKLAVKNGGSQEVKAFGQRMIDDHSKAGDELRAIAGRKNIPWPAVPDAKAQSLYDKLSTLNGEAFDREYVSAMISGHKAVAADLQTESKSGRDPEVKEWAIKTLPAVESHLNQAEHAHQ